MRVTKNKHSKSFLTNVHRNELIQLFYPKTVRDWNILPDEAVNATTREAFKERVLEHFQKE